MQTLRTLERGPEDAESPPGLRPGPNAVPVPPAPRPTGPLSGCRHPWRHHVAAGVHFVNRLLAPTPPGRWLQARLRRDLETREVAVPAPRAALATELRVAFLTDLHAGFYHGARELEELAERTLALAPDLVCLGGDLVDARREEVLLLDRFLRRLTAPLGVWAVPGNHEYYPARGLDLWLPFLEERGVRVLVNRGERIRLGRRAGTASEGGRAARPPAETTGGLAGASVPDGPSTGGGPSAGGGSGDGRGAESHRGDGRAARDGIGGEEANGGDRGEEGLAATLWIAGVDDLTESEPDLSAALEGRLPGEPTLLLSHHPDLFVEAATSEVDLQLSGHTHGGQVRLLGWSPLRHSAFGFQRGLFASGSSRLYVASGVGTTLAPLRLDAPAELTLLRWGGA